MPGMSQQKSVIDYGELANWIFLPPYIGLFPLSQVFYLKVSAQSSKAQVDASCGCLVSMVTPFSWQLCSIYSLLHISLYSPLSLRRRRNRSCPWCETFFRYASASVTALVLFFTCQTSSVPSFGQDRKCRITSASQHFGGSRRCSRSVAWRDGCIAMHFITNAFVVLVFALWVPGVSPMIVSDSSGETNGNQIRSVKLCSSFSQETSKIAPIDSVDMEEVRLF